MSDHTTKGGYIYEVVNGGNGDAEVWRGPRCVLSVSPEKPQVENNGKQILVSMKVVDGTDISPETPLSEAAVMGYDGDATIFIHYHDRTTEITPKVSEGSVSFPVSTNQPSGTSVVVEAVSLSTRPAKSDKVSIDVVQA